MDNNEIKVKYIGGGAALLPYTDAEGNEVAGVPARDLTAEEVRQHGGIVKLCNTGLYERVEEKPAKAGK